MDLLSDVLSLLDTRSSYFAGLKAGGDWAIDFPPPDGIKFNAVIEGGCWLTVAGIDAPVQLQTGDCFLLAPGRAFTLASTPGLPAARRWTCTGTRSRAWPATARRNTIFS